MKKRIRYQEKVMAGRDVYTLALERTRQVYETYSDVWVSFSGGKDSTVVLELARIVAREMGRLPLQVAFFDEEAVDPLTDEYIREVANDPDVTFRWTCIPVQHRNACSKSQPYWHPWDPRDREKWIRPLPDHPSVEACVPDAPHPRQDGAVWRVGVPELCVSPAYNQAEPWALKSGSRCYLLGLRAEESFRRARLMMLREHMNFVSSSHNGVCRASPIYDWTVGDVWKLIRDTKCGYTGAYLLQRYAGMAPKNQRVAHPFGEEPLESLWLWRLCFPDMWSRIVERVPGAATAADWGRSALYGKRGASKLYGGWEKDPHAALKAALRPWEPKTRKKIAATIREQMRVHAQLEPGVPIPLTKAGPSGVCWSSLIGLAHRGDLKSRAVEKLRKNRYVSRPKDDSAQD